MTTSLACDPVRLTGYRLEQLASAFDRVRDLRDWMAPVRAEIPAAAQSVTYEAVRWFTDTIPEFEASPEHPGRLKVTAAGYRLGPEGKALSGRPAAPVAKLRLMP